MAGGDAKQGAEGGVPGAAAVEAEDELVEVGLEMLAAQAMIDAQTPYFEVGEDPVPPATRWAAILPMTWGSWSTPGAPG